jgi:hypothetical protein
VIPLDEIAVVIPANNEELLVARCLESVVRSAEHLRSELGARAPRVSITLVADSCTDHTVELALAVPGVQVVQIKARSVGTARGAGAEQALERFARRSLASESYRSARRGHALERLWIANTDADSEVPKQWMLQQWSLARGGVDVVIGTVQPDFADLTPPQVQAWRSTHDAGQAVGNVHGANLGVRASRYVAAEGFADDTEHEDVSLVQRLVGAGSTVCATDDARVITSGRRVGRTPGGYAGYLRKTLASDRGVDLNADQPYRLVAG